MIFMISLRSPEKITFFELYPMLFN